MSPMRTTRLWTGRAIALAELAVILNAEAVNGKTDESRKGAARTVDETSSNLLSPEKQALVRNFVRQLNRMTRGTVQLPKLEETLAVGAAVPDTAGLFILPHDAFSEVPQVTSYRFLLASNGIAVVEPQSRLVVQMIEAP